MPATMEIKCTNSDCEVDMFELHFTYDIHDNPAAADFACPLCEATAGLQEITL